MNLKQLNINNNAGSAISAISSGGSGHGIFAVGNTSAGAGLLAKGGVTTGTYGIGIWADSGINSAPTSTGSGFGCKGAGSGSGMIADGPNGIVANGSNNGGKNSFVGNLTGDVLGVARANLIQIDGLATSGNNATLYLKGLDIRAGNSTTPAIFIHGFDGTFGSNDGSNAITITGGQPYGGTGNGNGGNGVFITGGTHFGSGQNGSAVRIIASGTGGGRGIYITGDYGQVPIELAGDSYTSGMRVTGGYGWIGGIDANIRGTLV